MKTYVIPKEDHKWLYIFEGSLLHYTIKNTELDIVVNCVDYPNLPKEIPALDYFDWVKIKFKDFSYLKLEYGYQFRKQEKQILNTLELGELKENDDLLDYGGALELLGGKYDIPTGFTIEIVCQEIELEFLSQELFK